MPVTHTKVATLADQPGVEINKAEWNANHTVSVALATEVTGQLGVANGGTGISNTGSLTFSGAASVTGTNTGDQTSISGNAATVTTNANLTGPIASVGNTTSITSQTGTGTTFVTDTSPTIQTSLAVAGTETITSANTSALAVGRLGATTPAFQVDASTGTQVAGLKVTGAATGGTVAVATIDSGAANNLTINALGTGTIGIGNSSTGAITLTRATTLSNGLTVSAGGITSNGLNLFNDTASNTAGNTRARFRNAADLALTAGSGATFFIAEMNNAIRTHASNTNIATQTDAVFLGTTHAFAAATGNISDLVCLNVTAGNIGTNATATNIHSVNVSTKALTAGITSSYGLTVNANSGATNNYAAQLLGGATRFGSVAAPTGTTGGEIWNDSTQNMMAFNNGNILYQSGNLYTATAPVTINSITPTTTFSGTKIGTTTIAAGSLKVGQKFAIWGAGYYSTPIGNTSTVTITVLIGGITVSTVTTGAFPATATNFPFDFVLQFTVQAVGSGTAAKIVCDGTFNYATALSAVAKTSNSLSTIGQISFDSTIANVLDVQASWSAVTTQSAVVQQAKIDFL